MSGVLGKSVLGEERGGAIESLTLADRLRSLDHEAYPEAVRKEAAELLLRVQSLGLSGLAEQLIVKYQTWDPETQVTSMLSIVEILTGDVMEGSFRAADLLDEALLMLTPVPWGTCPLTDEAEMIAAQLRATTARSRGPVPDESHRRTCDECGVSSSPGSDSEEQAAHLARWSQWLVGDRDLCPTCCLTEGVTPPPPLSKEFLAAPRMMFSVEAYQGIVHKILPEEFAGWIAASVSPADRLDLLLRAEDPWFSQRGGYAMEILTALKEIPATGPYLQQKPSWEMPSSPHDGGELPDLDAALDEAERLAGLTGDNGRGGDTDDPIESSPSPSSREPGWTVPWWIAVLLSVVIGGLGYALLLLGLDLDNAEYSNALHTKSVFEERAGIKELDYDRRGNTFRVSGEIRVLGSPPKPVRYTCDKDSCHFECAP